MIFMRIEKIKIEKFRWFQDAEFDLGSYLTVIAWQNGTQKTTVLGMLTQPFSITDKANPLYWQVPLSGWTFRSAFSDKFKFSKKFDKPWEHERTLFFNDDTTYTTHSIQRYNSKRDIRFWKKGDKSKGSWYIQLPVIYLSLKRLLPIGEDLRIKEKEEIQDR